MSQIEKLIRAFVLEVLASSSSVMNVSIKSENVTKLCENAREAFPSVLEFFETFKSASTQDEVRTRDALAVLLRRLGVTLGAQPPGYGLEEWDRWVGWGRQFLPHISRTRK